MNLITCFNIELGIVLAWFVMVYYIGMVDIRKSPVNMAAAIIGYLLYGAAALLEIPLVNICVGMAVNTVILRIVRQKPVKVLLIEAAQLTVLYMFGELIMALCLEITINAFDYTSNISFKEDIIYTFISKAIYFVEVAVLKRITVASDGEYQHSRILYVIVLPCSTSALLGCLAKISAEVSDRNIVLLIAASCALIVANFVVCLIYNVLIKKYNMLMDKSGADAERANMYSEHYKQLEAQYKGLKAVAHDIGEYCDIVDRMANDDNDGAQLLIHDMKDRMNDFLLTAHTDNPILDAVLLKKIHVCNESAIELKSFIDGVSFAFISETDTISVFSNILDNVADICRISQGNNITLSSYAINKAYIVIKAETTCSPKAAREVLAGEEYKRRNESISAALSRYCGMMSAQYDDVGSSFAQTAVIGYYKATGTLLC